MQLTASFDQRSPNRLVVRLGLGDVVHDLDQLVGAGRVRAVKLADLEADLAVRSVRMAWPGSYMPAPIVMTQPRVRCATGHRRHALVVDAVLEVDDHAVRLLQEPHDERGGPLGVVRP